MFQVRFHLTLCLFFENPQELYTVTSQTTVSISDSLQHTIYIIKTIFVDWKVLTNQYEAHISFTFCV